MTSCHAVMSLLLRHQANVLLIKISGYTSGPTPAYYRFHLVVKSHL